MWDFPDVIKFRVAAHTISEKATRFRHPDYNPDKAQKLISSSMSRHLSTPNISSKSMHAFLSNLANRQTETDRQINERGQTYLPPLLSEVKTISGFSQRSLELLLFTFQHAARRWRDRREHVGRCLK